MADQTSATAEAKKPANVLNIKVSDAGRELLDLAIACGNVKGYSEYLRRAVLSQLRADLESFGMLDDAAKAELARGIREPKDSE